jgi:hypothetical protein
MPIDQYRIRRSTSQRAPDVRDRGSGYVESPTTLDRQLAEGLERTRAMLEQQRARIKREAELARSSVAAGKDTV